MKEVEVGFGGTGAPQCGQVAASVLTCWGDGSLNFRRASDEAVRAVVGRHATAAQANRLIQEGSA